jgi:hypothetical protein
MGANATALLMAVDDDPGLLDVTRRVLARDMTRVFQAPEQTATQPHRLITPSATAWA